MTPKRPDLAPAPGLSRSEMERLQRAVAAAAVFEDDLEFDPATVSLSDAAPLTGSLRDWSPSGDEYERPLVAGVDQAFLDDRAVSAVVVMRGSDVVERTYAVSNLSIPYIPGLLSFREGGPILDAFATLECDPDLALFDGSGRIHFRQAGIATHMGVVLGLPSVGVAKSLLCGTPAESVEGRPEGWRTPIVADGRVERIEADDSATDASDESGVDAGDRPDADADDPVLGYAYQSRQYDSRPIVNPLYVSPGHRVSTETAVDLVARLCGDYKLPEPTRLADSYAAEVKSDVV